MHADDGRPPGRRGDVVRSVHDIDPTEGAPLARPRHVCPETESDAGGHGQAGGVLRKCAGPPRKHVGHEGRWFVERAQCVGESGGVDGDARVRAEERRDIDTYLQRHGRSTVVVGAAATLAAVPPTDSAPDLDVIAAEIAAEVHRRRANGEFPPDLERRLDAAFARYSPPGSLGATAEGLLERAEECTAIDTDPPTASQRSGAPVFKQGIKRAMAWYINFVVGQVSALGGHLVAAGRVLDRRVTRLESLVSDASDLVTQERRFAPVSPLDDGTARRDCPPAR